MEGCNPIFVAALYSKGDFVEGVPIIAAVPASENFPKQT